MAKKYYTYYLIFVLIACTGAIIWQLFLPNLASTNSSWGFAPGWQREIVLWNVALVLSIIYGLLRKDRQSLNILTFQSTILFFVLEINHAIAFFQNLPTFYSIHFLGILEVLLLGGGWGIYALVKGNKYSN